MHCCFFNYHIFSVIYTKIIIFMKNLELNQMEVLQGGEVNCSIATVAGVAVAMGIFAVFTGGVSLAIASIVVMNGGGLAAGAYC